MSQKNYYFQIVYHGALPLFKNMLVYSDSLEQTAAAHAIWNLSFDKDVRKKITARPELVNALENLANNSDNGEVKESCKGALWVLREKSMESAKTLERAKTKLTKEKGGFHSFANKI